MWIQNNTIHVLSVWHWSKAGRSFLLFSAAVIHVSLCHWDQLYSRWKTKAMKNIYFCTKCAHTDKYPKNSVHQPQRTPHWWHSMIANVSIPYPANVLLAMAVHFNMALLFRCTFGLCATKCCLCRLYCLSLLKTKKRRMLLKKKLVTCSKCKTSVCNLVQHYPCRDKCTSISENVLHWSTLTEVCNLEHSWCFLAVLAHCPSQRPEILLCRSIFQRYEKKTPSIAEEIKREYKTGFLNICHKHWALMFWLRCKGSSNGINYAKDGSVSRIQILKKHGKVYWGSAKKPGAKGEGREVYLVNRLCEHTSA